MIKCVYRSGLEPVYLSLPYIFVQKYKTFREYEINLNSILNYSSYSVKSLSVQLDTKVCKIGITEKLIAKVKVTF